MYRSASLAYRIADSFFRHWPLFALSAAVVAGVVALFTLGRAQTYVASAATQVSPETELTSALGIGQQSWITPAQQSVDRFNNLMRDDLPDGFIDSFLRHAQLDTPISLDPDVRDPRLERLRKNLYASADSSEVFTITLVWDNPRECEKIVSAIQKQFIDQTGMTKQASSIATANFLDSQINIYRARMKAAENALIAYKQTHAGQLPDAQEGQLEQYGQLQAELDYLKITQHDSALRRAYIQQRLSQIKPVNVEEQVLTESPVEAQIKQLQAHRSDLIADNWLPTSEKVRAVDDEIHELRKSLADPTQQQNKMAPGTPGHIAETRLQNNPEYEDLTSQLNQASIDQQTQQARMALLETRLQAYQKQIEQLPAAQRLLTEKTRDYTILKGEFEDLLQRREQARIKANLDKVVATSTITPLGSIIAQSTTSTKKQVTMIAVALALGLVVATALLLLSETLDPTLRYADDAERLLGMPVLGYLPDDPSLADAVTRRPPIVFGPRNALPAGGGRRG